MTRVSHIVLALVLATLASAADSGVRLRSLRQVVLSKTAGDVSQIIIARDGYVLVRDADFRHPATQAIEMYDGSGRLVRRIGSFGRGPGQYFRLFGIGLDTNGIIWAADKNKVIKYESSGKVAGEILIQSPGYSATGIALDEQRDSFYLAGCLPEKVYLNFGCKLVHRYSFASASYLASNLETDPRALKDNLLPLEYYMVDVDEAGRVYAIDAPIFKLFQTNFNPVRVSAFNIFSRAAVQPEALPQGVTPDISEAAFDRSFFLDHVVATRSVVAVSIRKPRGSGFVLEAFDPNGRQILVDAEPPGRLVGKTTAGHFLFAARTGAGFEIHECSLTAHAPAM